MRSIDELIVQIRAQGAADAANQYNMVAGSLDNVTNKAQAAAQRMDMIGNVMLGAGAAMAAGLGAAIAQAAKFDQALRNTAAVGLMTTQEMKQLADGLASLRPELEALGRSQTEAAEGAWSLKSAGMETADILKTIVPAAQMAAAQGVELERSTALLVATMNQFGMTTEDTTRIVDGFSAANAATLADFAKIEESMRYVGAAAGLFGQEFEAALTVVGEFWNMGLRGEQAGTTFRAAFNMIAQGGSKTAETFDRLGLSLEKAQSLLSQPREMIKYLATATWDATAAAAAFGSEAMAFGTVINNGLPVYDALYEKITENGIASTMAGMQMAGASGQLRILKATVIDSAIALGTVFLPVLTTTSQWLGAVAGWFTTLSPLTQTLIGWTFALGSAVLILGGAYLKVRSMQAMLALASIARAEADIAANGAETVSANALAAAYQRANIASGGKLGMAVKGGAYTVGAAATWAIQGGIASRAHEAAREGSGFWGKMLPMIKGGVASFLSGGPVGAITYMGRTGYEAVTQGPSYWQPKGKGTAATPAAGGAAAPAAGKPALGPQEALLAQLGAMTGTMDLGAGGWVGPQPATGAAVTGGYGGTELYGGGGYTAPTAPQPVYIAGASESAYSPMQPMLEQMQTQMADQYTSQQEQAATRAGGKKGGGIAEQIIGGSLGESTRDALSRLTGRGQSSILGQLRRTGNKLTFEVTFQGEGAAADQITERAISKVAAALQDIGEGNPGGALAWAAGN